MAEVQFLFDNGLIAGLENLIKESKQKLLLVSPYIDLDNRIKDALKEKLSVPNFELRVLFGKNEYNLYKSIKKDSFEFLKQFSNVEIRYEERLHAKFYLNDFDFILTSLNLYDYSLAKNIEVGIICNYGTKGLIGRVVDGTGSLINQGVGKVTHDVFGISKDVNPIEKFQTIFENAVLKYKTEPLTVNAGGVKGILGGKKLDGFNVIVDNLSTYIGDKAQQSTVKDIVVPKEENKSNVVKTLSASQISKSLSINQSDLTKLMQAKGLIDGNKITNLGLARGLVMKNYMGNDYIAYPDNLVELDELKS